MTFGRHAHFLRPRRSAHATPAKPPSFRRPKVRIGFLGDAFSVLGGLGSVFSGLNQLGVFGSPRPQQATAPNNVSDASGGYQFDMPMGYDQAFLSFPDFGFGRDESTGKMKLDFARGGPVPTANPYARHYDSGGFVLPSDWYTRMPPVNSTAKPPVNLTPYSYPDLNALRAQLLAQQQAQQGTGTPPLPGPDPVFHDDVLGGTVINKPPTDSMGGTGVPVPGTSLPTPGGDIWANVPGGDPGQGVGVPGPSAPSDAALASAIGLATTSLAGLAPSPVSTVSTIAGLVNALAPGVLSNQVSVNGLSTNNVTNDVNNNIANSVGIVGPTSLAGMIGNALGLTSPSTSPAIATAQNAAIQSAISQLGPVDTLAALSAGPNAAPAGVDSSGNPGIGIGGGPGSGTGDSPGDSSGNAFRRGGRTRKARGGYLSRAAS